MRESLVNEQPAASVLQLRGLSVDIYRLTTSLAALGRYEEALQLSRPLLPMLEKHLAGRTDAESQELLAKMYYTSGRALVDSGKLSEALVDYRNSAAIRERILKDQTPPDASVSGRLAGTYGAIAIVFWYRGELAEAVAEAHRAILLIDGLLARYPQSVAFRENRAAGFYSLAHFLAAQGKADEALQAYREALSMFHNLTSDNPKDVLAMRLFGFCYQCIGQLLADNGQPRQGLDNLRKALAIFRSLPTDDSKNVFMLTAFADTNEGFGTGYEALRRLGEASTYYKRSLAIWEDMQRQIGALHPEDRGKPDRLRRAIERCEHSVGRH